MKKHWILLISILLSKFSYADCDAPDLTFSSHSDELYGYKITRIPGDYAIGDQVKINDTLIDLNGVYFLFHPLSSSEIVSEVKITQSKTKSNLMQSMKSSEHYYGERPQTFEVGEVRGYDLTGDLQVDILLFEVDSYTGAVGLLDSKWVVVIEPMCC